MADVTSYEIAAKHTDGRAVLIGYINGRSLNCLVQVVRKWGGEVITLLDMAEDEQFDITKGRDACLKWKGWTVGYTGRTKLDARDEGALPFIADYFKAA